MSKTIITDLDAADAAEQQEQRDSLAELLEGVAAGLRRGMDAPMLFGMVTQGDDATNVMVATGSTNDIAYLAMLAQHQAMAAIADGASEPQAERGRH